eukprot:TRINITY_DN4985_c0_g3_i2.p1 TRINITY_DN4985_c0_g3~~TRINITY_DN4985_c0_g3_i2.p1  ORF type:complete len:552 (+),score=132.19 TRINITY_DN4985_c0_g3_i2:241-1656(+)
MQQQQQQQPNSALILVEPSVPQVGKVEQQEQQQRQHSIGKHDITSSVSQSHTFENSMIGSSTQPKSSENQSTAAISGADTSVFHTQDFYSRSRAIDVRNEDSSILRMLHRASSNGDTVAASNTATSRNSSSLHRPISNNTSTHSNNRANITSNRSVSSNASTAANSTLSERTEDEPNEDALEVTSTDFEHHHHQQQLPHLHHPHQTLTAAQQRIVSVSTRTISNSSGAATEDSLITGNSRAAVDVHQLPQQNGNIEFRPIQIFRNPHERRFSAITTNGVDTNINNINITTNNISASTSTSTTTTTSIQIPTNGTSSISQHSNTIGSQEERNRNIRQIANVLRENINENNIANSSSNGAAEGNNNNTGSTQAYHPIRPVPVDASAAHRQLTIIDETGSSRRPVPTGFPINIEDDDSPSPSNVSPFRVVCTKSMTESELDSQDAREIPEINPPTTPESSVDWNNAPDNIMDEC